MSLENYPNFLLNFSVFNIKIKKKHFYRCRLFRLKVGNRQLLKNGNAI